MATELKTQRTDASVWSFIDGIADAQRREDCRQLAQMMEAVTGEEPAMWGAAMVGFGAYDYRYQSGHGGSSFLCGFSPRKQNLTIYFSDGVERHTALLGGLGRYTHGRSCLYVKRLSDIDQAVLKEMVIASVANMRADYPQG